MTNCSRNINTTRTHRTGLITRLPLRNKPKLNNNIDYQENKIEEKFYFAYYWKKKSNFSYSSMKAVLLKKKKKKNRSSL